MKLRVVGFIKTGRSSKCPHYGTLFQWVPTKSVAELGAKHRNINIRVEYHTKRTKKTNFSCKTLLHDS